MNVPAFMPAAFRPWREYDRVYKAEDLYFYHTTDLPEPVGTAKGHWDLRGAESVYLGHVDVKNKSVFDCGTASGFMAFEMEKRGAQVAGLDLDEARCEKMGLIPFHDFEQRFGFSYETAIRHRKEGQERLRNSFLYTRQLKNSSINLYIGDIMKDEIALPNADIALFGCILLHLNDPLSAIHNVAKKVNQTIIVTDVVEGSTPTLADPAVLALRPDINVKGNPGTWNYPHPAWIKRALGLVGFSKFELHKGYIADDTGLVEIFSLVADK